FAQCRMAQRVFLCVIVGEILYFPAISLLTVDKEFKVLPAPLLPKGSETFSIRFARIGTRNIVFLSCLIYRHRADVVLAIVRFVEDRVWIGQCTICVVLNAVYT